MLIIHFILTLIRKNPVKVSLLFITPFFFFFGLNSQDVQMDLNLITQFSDGGKFHYVVKKQENYDIYDFDKPAIINNNQITIIEKSVIYTISLIVLTLIAVFFFAAFIVGLNDTDLGWEISDVIIESKLKLVKCDFEDEIYYYHYRGKLIAKKSFQVDISTLVSALKKPLNILPDFKGTKSQIRDKKLKSLIN